MSNRKVLFVTEGENDEPRFIKQLYAIFSPNDKGYSFFRYTTSLHVLAKRLEDEYPDFENEDIDIKLFLRATETQNEQRKLLEERYTDIFLVFDMDPHDPRTQFGTIEKMVRKFNDSMDQGKLYINYPMMQSYKHFSVLPDPSFMELKVAIDECGRYKRIVGDVSKYTDIRHYDEQLFISIAAHHLRKANYLLVGDYVVPSMEGFLSWDYSKLFRIQLNHVEFRKFVYVLNTCIFILIENNPIKFWHYIEDTCGSYLI